MSKFTHNGKQKQQIKLGMWYKLKDTQAKTNKQSSCLKTNSYVTLVLLYQPVQADNTNRYIPCQP